MKIEKYPEEANTIPMCLPHTVTVDWHARWLIWKARQTMGDILEIGTNKGEMAKEFSTHFPDRSIWTVDWPENDSIQEWQRKEVLPIGTVGNLCHDCPNVHPILMDSRKLDYASFKDVGFIFIDGDHSYEGVKADTELAVAYCKEMQTKVQGHPRTIAWHDYYPKEQESAARVRDYLDSRTDLNLVEVEGITIVYLDFA